MENRKYFVHPTGKLNQDYQMEDANKNPVYEAKAVKKGILTAWQFEFTECGTGKTEMHKVGHTVTTEQHTGVGFGALGALGNVASDAAAWLSTRSWFKFDGKKIWDYLHEEGIRIDSKLAEGRLGMAYRVTLKGQDLATLTMAAPDGKKSFLTGKFWYEVEMKGDNLYLAFLTTFAIARTEQMFYD